MQLRLVHDSEDEDEDEREREEEEKEKHQTYDRKLENRTLRILLWVLLLFPYIVFLCSTARKLLCVGPREIPLLEDPYR